MAPARQTTVVMSTITRAVKRSTRMPPSTTRKMFGRLYIAFSEPIWVSLKCSWRESSSAIGAMSS